MSINEFRVLKHSIQNRKKMIHKMFHIEICDNVKIV